VGGVVPRSREHAEADNEMLARVEQLYEQKEKDQDAQEDCRKHASTSVLFLSHMSKML